LSNERFFWLLYKKSPTAQEVGSCGARCSFSGGSEEGYLCRAGHSTSSMVVKISVLARKTYVETRIV
jgi:hypothetical protein